MNSYCYGLALRALLRGGGGAAVIAGAIAAAAACASAQQRINLDGIWQVRQEAAPEAHYQAVHVPGAFETVLGQDFDGTVRYRRSLPLPAARTKKAFVEFEAVATHATVYANGRRCARHLGGWTPFRADLSRHLRWDGTDVLEVVVDERVGHNTQGFLPIIQPHFGGIWQSCHLVCTDTPLLDRHDLFVFGDMTGSVTVTAGIVRTRRQPDALRIEILDGERVVAAETRSDLTRFAEPLQITEPKLWSPGAPHLYTARLSLLQNHSVVDTVERRFACRSLRADGTRVLWNDVPLQMRGVLHWGFSPPALAPPSDPEHWRQQIEYFRSLGFNTIKCCLWIPPSCFYELCDELGMIVWQEYPTWHPQLDQAHKRELLAEYREFYRNDRSHPSVAFRSITCETGHSADLDVVRTLFETCKAMVPQALVVDDSSWIGWQRITDFWDEHPYGNNTWLPGRIADFQRHMQTNGKKPLLLGECIAADTWIDRDSWLRQHGEQPVWWRPLCWDAQTQAEQRLVAAFGSHLLASLAPASQRFAMQNRQAQIELLRLRAPDAGYVVSVARDFPKARMGLIDDLDRAKFSAADWQWHRATMLCLDLAPGARALGPQQNRVPVRVSHYGAASLRGNLRIWCEDPFARVERAIELDPGSTSAKLSLPITSHATELRRVRVHAELTGSHPARSHWDLWIVPSQTDREAAPIIETEVLTTELIEQMEQGARVYLRVRDRKDTLRSDAMWFLKGAPFAPTHPVHDVLPADCLLEMSSFDLESGRVMPWQGLWDQVDPILAFWETHDIPEVRLHLHAFDTQVGKGRLLATALRDDGPATSLPHHVGSLLRNHLATGSKPQRALRAATIAALKAKLNEKQIDLENWRFRTDPDNVGQAANWQSATVDTGTAAWRDLKAGSHWENQGEDLRHYTGVAWYRIDVEVPEHWRGLAARCVLDGVDDSCHIWLNGELVGTFGDEATKTTIWLEQQVAELGTRLRAGERNTITLRVVDHAGAGGLWKPVRLTTGPVGPAGELLR